MMLLVLEESRNPTWRRASRVPWIGGAQTRAGWDTAYQAVAKISAEGR